MADTVENLAFNATPLDTLGIVPLTSYTGNLVVDYTTMTVTGNLTVSPVTGVVSTTTFTSFTLVAGPNNTYTITGTGTTADALASMITIAYTGMAPGTVASNYSVSGLSVASSSGGAVTSTTACYVSGTLIATTRGDVAVETLAIGDVVVTASGQQRPIKWLGNRAYAVRFANANPTVLPICIKAGALDDNVPARDLWVSAKHALYLDGVLIPAELLVNDVSIVQATQISEDLVYWHVELDSHDILLAEGAAAESFVDDDDRGIFQNADSFRQLYPATRREEAAYYAARVESGYAFEAARARIAQRAGLPAPATRTFGALHGNLDTCAPGQDGLLVQGWAQDAAYPNAPVCLDILVDGKVVALAYAETYRSDLEQAGIGDGRHAFSVSVPASATSTIEVRRSADKAPVGARQMTAALKAA